MNIMQKEENIYSNYEDFTSETLLFLHPEQIKLSDTPKKGRISENARIRMAESIRKYGILQPFQVRPTKEDCGYTCYRLLSEEERFRAACMAGIERIPCRLLAPGDRLCEGDALLAEFKAKPHHFFDEAAFFERLIRQYGLKQAEIAKKAGISQSTVANKLRLLQLGEREQASIRTAGLGERHARAILRLTDPGIRISALEAIILRHFSVAEAEQYIEELLLKRASPAQNNKTEQEPEPLYRERATYVEQSPMQSTLRERHFEAVEAGLNRTNSFAPTTEEAPPKPANSRRRIVTEIPEPQGIRPNRFILHDLQPLYNSIERTLSIFRKTGMAAECTREEYEDGVEISIRIPKPRGTAG